MFPGLPGVLVEPACYENPVIQKAQFAKRQASFAGNGRQFQTETDIPLAHPFGTGDTAARMTGTQPIPHSRNRLPDVIVVSADILARNIRAINLVPKRLSVQYQARLLRLPRPTVLLRPKEDPEFQRHIEPWQLVRFIKTRAGQIVNAEPALADHLIDLLKPDLTPVILLAGAPSQESAIVDSENEGVEDFLVTRIKRNVYENSSS
jgi:hypothetical protein